MAEHKVLALLTQHNKPFNVQNTSDFLATQGVKKAACQKALDALAERGDILVKEFGKTKIYIPKQQGLDVMSKEEQEAKKGQLKELQTQLQAESAAAKEAEAELLQWQSSLTVEELRARVQALEEQAHALGAKLEGLRSGAVLVTPEERQAVRQALVAAHTAYRKRRGVFRSIWGTLSESLEGRESDLFEEIGVESDAAAAYDAQRIERFLLGGGGGGGAKRARVA